MNDSIKRISLDIHKPSSNETVNAKRGDTARKLYISLVEGGIPYIISEDCYAVFTAKKPDGKAVYNDCAIENNTIIYEVTEQTVAVEGRVNCEIKLYGADDKLITSSKFTIIVYGTVYNEGDEIESSDEFNALTSLMSDTQKTVKEAQEAIKVAQEMEASLLITEASGSPIAIDNAAEHSVIGLKLYGRTTQDGTPTPDAPVELVSIGDSGSIAVNVTGENKSQSMTIATPNGLPGIPVTSGGNYTDEDGQQWICDEIDLTKGVYINRIARAYLDGSETWVAIYTSTAGKYRCYCNIDAQAMSFADAVIPPMMCNQAQIVGVTTTFALLSGVTTAGDGKGLYFYDEAFNTEDVSLLRQHLANNPMVVLYLLATPVETPLSEEELAAYAALHTYRNHTTVTNDASAHMELEYVMDAKKYIDSLVKTPPAARLSWVTIKASAWTGADSLYSQVVAIDGITPYNKVDLLPSVEQLAIFHNKDVAFVTENEDGVVTVYAIGEKPIQDYTMQVSITEVIA